jgi:flagellar assembly protein FliH
VRLLPGRVRVTRGRIEDVGPESSVLPQDDKVERSALDIAEAEVKSLRIELRGRESDLAEARGLCKSLSVRLESEREELRKEQEAFRESSSKEASEAKEAARAAGYEEGRSAGYAEGLGKAESDVRSEYEGKFSGAVSLLEGMARELSGSRERLAASHAPQLIRLWEMMLGRMLQTMVEMDADVTKRIVGTLLRRISDRERIVVYLNPADAAMIQESKDQLMDSIRGVKFFEFMSDDHVDRGSCLIETNLGIYDARWKTQLEQVSSEVQSLLVESMAADEPGGD